jgi:hypothetical protein
MFEKQHARQLIHYQIYTLFNKQTRRTDFMQQYSGINENNEHVFNSGLGKLLIKDKDLPNYNWEIVRQPR